MSATDAVFSLKDDDLQVTLALKFKNICPPLSDLLTWTGMSKQEHDRHCPPGSVAAGQPPPVMKEPPSGVRHLSPLPGREAQEISGLSKTSVCDSIRLLGVCMVCIFTFSFLSF